MYMTLIAHCFRCDIVFTCNPNLVPSIKDIDGIKKPLCKSCVKAIQDLQRSNRIQVWPDPLPGAYDPEEEI